MNALKINEYSRETSFLDFKNADFQDFMKPIKCVSDQKEQAIAIYEFVRDTFLYDPFHLDLRPTSLKASEIIRHKRAWCVEKAIVACACFRAFGIPSRLGFGIVKNHIGVEKLVQFLKREEIVFHGFVEVFLNSRWVKCTPAFDEKVCRVSKVPVLEWDGEKDSLFQSYVAEKKFMEYLHFYGSFDDVPLALMHAEMKKYYPHLFENQIIDKAFSFRYLDDLVSE
ncbi:MAG TPA: transglutaminase-like domain-containing protein [Fluviicola sp.]|nr:transglutaminase-like domain-containing protein [Fluviicola sp.]